MGPRGPLRPVINPTTGHDYRRGDDCSIPVDVPRVDSLLARRLACKMSRRYEEADRLRQELRDMGVEVQDKLKIWRVVRPVPKMPKISSRGAIDPTTGHDYQRDRRDFEPVDLFATNKLIAERLQCKMGGDYIRADQIRNRLRLELGVEVNDRDKVWRVALRPLKRQRSDEPATDAEHAKRHNPGFQPRLSPEAAPHR